MTWRLAALIRLQSSRALAHTNLYPLAIFPHQGFIRSEAVFGGCVRGGEPAFIPLALLRLCRLLGIYSPLLAPGCQRLAVASQPLSLSDKLTSTNPKKPAVIY
ncbi:hypothetical protein Maes01_01443 [Microbulbifer aestuariivivens]|uniref:Transposase DDE domain-containing protein n=1 Tax=Microbulbifer aestuariivivens TaxID=1908308 RepID=A0ABP9WNU8_9GAMM